MRLKISYLVFFILIISISMINCAQEDPELQNIKARLDAYAVVEIEPDLSVLNEEQKQAFHKLVEAGKAIDPIFWKQQDPVAVQVRAELSNPATELERYYKEYVELNYGPFDARLNNERFYGTGGEKYDGAGYYPRGMTQEEFQSYVEAHPDQKEALEGLYTVVKRQGDELTAVSYHDEFSADVQAASTALREASEFTRNSSLKKYLALRSEALAADDYYESDMAWMDLKDNLLDIVIGPIETYEDELNGLKASYECAVLIKDVQQSENLNVYKQHLDNLEHNLPEDDKYKRSTVGTGNILELFNVGYFSGDYNKAIKTIAASLPNDPRVIAAKGSKKLMYNNVLEAKFEKILVPLSQRLLMDDMHAFVSKSSFITNILLHEISHTLGPLEVYGSGGTTLRQSLREHYSPLEECKADIIGIFSSEYFNNAGVFDDATVKNNYVTFIGSIFRSIRFGLNSAHGRANMMQFNYLIEKGGIEKSGSKYSINFDKFKEAIEELAGTVLTIQATGDYDAAGEMLEKYAIMPDELRTAFENMSDIPVDLKFVYKY
ncbi:MAG: Zn-dependent hydrolase [bacterium]|nr:Zn-dependent hydrolase [bacterium]